MEAVYKYNSQDSEELLRDYMEEFYRAYIDALIDATEGMTDISKTYMKKSLAMRLNQMLLPAWKKAQERQASEDAESRGFSR